MAIQFIVEDNTGLVDATSYAATAAADQYFENIGKLGDWNASGPGDSDEKQVALNRATQYIDFRWKFSGSIFNTDADGNGNPQSLMFPRDLIFDSRGIDWSEFVPIQIKQATYEYALIALGGDLLPALTDQPTDGKFVTLSRQKVASLEEETRFSASKGTKTVKIYPVADRIIRSSGLLGGSGDQVVRA